MGGVKRNRGYKTGEEANKANTAKAPVETFRAEGRSVRREGQPFLRAGARPKQNPSLVPSWPRCPSILRGHAEGWLNSNSWGQGETRQFKADRFRKRATRHSNF